MERIGVRELRQHASRYLARVRTGEAFEVTDHGRLVARLVPAGADPWDDLLAAGLVVAGDGTDLLAAEPVALPAGTPRPSAVLAAMRADER